MTCERQLKPLVLWLGVTPTTYNNFYLSQLNARLEGNLEVVFAAEGIPDGTWPAPTDINVRFYRRPWGLDLTTLREVTRQKQALVFVCGWSDKTTKVSLTLLAALRRRYVIWTDTPDNTVGWRHILRNLAVRTWARSALAVMATGHPGVLALERIGIPPQRIVNFPFWVDIPPRAEIMKQMRGPARFCSIGRLVPRKGVDVAIRALAQAGQDVDASLDVVGTGPERERLGALAAELGISNRVRFLGRKDEAQIKQYLSTEPHCLIHAAPEHDPFPVAVLEAMAHGLAILATDCSGSAIDRVEDGKSGFIVPSAAPLKILADRIRQLALAPELLRSMQACARARAEEWPVKRGVQIVMNLARHPRGMESGSDDARQAPYQERKSPNPSAESSEF